MENRNSKNMDHYFEQAKQLPLAMDFAQIKEVIAAKGVTSPPNKSWWNLNNFILMTTSIMVLSAALWLFNTTDDNANINYQPYTTGLSSIHQSKSNQPQSHQLVSTAKQNEAENQTAEKLEAELESGLMEMFSGKDNTSNHQKKSTVAEDNFIPEDNYIPIQDSLAEMEKDDLPEQSNLGGEFDGKSKTIKKEFDIDGVTTLVLAHRNGDVVIDTWNQDKIEVTATFKIKTKEAEDELLALADFDIDLKLFDTKATVQSNWDELNNCSCGPNRTTEPKSWLGKLFYFPSKNTAKTENDKNIEYDNFKIEYSIKIPTKLSVDVSNQYANVTVADIEGTLEANLFRGDLSAGNVGGDLDLTIKYGESTVGNYQEGDVNLFRSDLKLGAGTKLDLKANYSEVEMKRIEDLSLNAFRSNLATEGGNVVAGSIKYGDIVFKQAITNADIRLFRANMTGTSFDRIDLSASYSNLKAEKVFQLIMEQGFRSEINVAQIGTLKGSAQYSPIETKLLTNEVDLKLFRGDLKVEMVGADFTSIKINSKYTDVDVHFDQKAKYDLQAKTTYTDLSVPNEILSKTKQNQQSSQTQNVSGTFNASSAKQPSLVNLEAFHGLVKLN